MNSLVAEVLAKRGDPDTRECGGWQDRGDLSVKIKTKFTGWICLPLLNGGPELVPVRIPIIIERMHLNRVKTQA